VSAHEDSITAWHAIARWWDDLHGGEGSDFHRTVIAPLAVELLAVRAGDLVLDVACGNGQFSRRLAAAGARVVAFDASAPFIDRARARAGEDAHRDRVEYHVIDATDERAMVALRPARFDAAVANMALMDIAELAPLFRALAALLKPGGRFVFTMHHPCFASMWPPPTLLGRAVSIGTHLLPGAGARAVKRLGDALHAGRYLVQHARGAVAYRGQPVPYPVFHRPLSQLLAPAFAAGLVLDELREPPQRGEPGRAAVLACRLRKLTDAADATRAESSTATAAAAAR
jgi:SAM-dependent methyltransferase